MYLLFYNVASYWENIDLTDKFRFVEPRATTGCLFTLCSYSIIISEVIVLWKQKIL